ncbi:hypothetical protein OD350_18205 [Clostridium beijerinckii]|uniref:hypothetical protein n=1 Tax=Clostridium beijerinckii TaxID=1520 RepID=UPI002226F78A|nr:hypothetical protein [Clostridium beijerinckii]UYZ34178.1 hypothetical protein OD350_18205 [Clostridium beijerinckii]
MAKVKREQFTLNPASPREKVINDFLQTQYNKADFIKDLLYDYIISNNLHMITQPIQHNVVINTVTSLNDAVNIPQNSQHNIVNVDDSIQHNAVNNTDNLWQVSSNITSSLPKDTANNNHFSIDLNSIDDEEVNVSTGEKTKSATENALDYMLNM